MLAEHFVHKFSRQQGKAIDSIPEEVAAALKRHDWPGNIRELQNVIERRVVMTTGLVLSWQTKEPLTGGDIRPVRPTEAAGPMRIKTMADAERAHITATLRETQWVVGGPRGAAARLGLPRTTLLARMQRLGMSSETLRRRSGRAPRLFGAVMRDLYSRSAEEAATVQVMEPAVG